MAAGHLLAQPEVITSATRFRRTQIGFAYPTGQGAVGDGDLMICFEELLDSHDIALTPGKGLLQQRQDVGRNLRFHRPLR